MDDEEWNKNALVAADELKAKGNEHFSRNELPEALGCYHKVGLHVRGLIQSAPNGFKKYRVSAEDIKRAEDLIQTCELNKAAIYIKQEKWQKGIEACTKVLAKQPNNVKALYRIGVCWMNVGDLDRSKEMLEMASTLSPADGGVTAALQKLKAKEKQQDAKDRKVYSKLFS